METRQHDPLLKHPLFLQILSQVINGYRMDINGIHGIRHWMRVCNNGLHLAEVNGSNSRVTSLFSILHDSQRETEGSDFDHGRRAALYIESISDVLLGLISNDEYDLLCYACKHHVDGLNDSDVTVQTCWDADRIELGRVGIPFMDIVFSESVMQCPDLKSLYKAGCRDEMHKMILNAWDSVI